MENTLMYDFRKLSKSDKKLMVEVLRDQIDFFTVMLEKGFVGDEHLDEVNDRVEHIDRILNKLAGKKK